MIKVRCYTDIVQNKKTHAIFYMSLLVCPSGLEPEPKASEAFMVSNSTTGTYGILNVTVISFFNFIKFRPELLFYMSIATAAKITFTIFYTIFAALSI